MSDEEDDGTRRYGTIEGVFVPTLLTILGVILFLRTGWVVGNAGLLGAVGIIAAGFVITGLTALSLASVSTNVTPNAGGAYALVARGFGIEAGGAVGLPLFLSQSLVIVLYTFGFRGGWLAIFPDHPAIAVDVGMLVVLVGVALTSTKAAFRTQFVVLAVVAAALVTVAVAAVTGPLQHGPPLVGAFPGAPEDGFPGTDVWTVFAVFFPATTGIMAGLNLSGELRDPRRSIARGTLAAVGVSLVIYLGVAVFLAFAAPVDELVGDYLVLASRSAWAPAVLAGLLAATFSSALASLVGAPRILQALADHGLPPGASWLARRDRRGEPRNALVVTVVIVAVALLLRDLNAIAPLITMTFLLAYAAINVVVLVETLVDLPSYRPTFRVPWPVPLAGAVGCIVGMLVIHPWFALFALLGVLGVFAWLTARDMERPVSDIRSAALLSLARWASKKAAEVHSSAERTWAANLLVPVGGHEDLARARTWVPPLAESSGPVKLVVVSAQEVSDDLDAATRDVVEELHGQGLEATSSEIEMAEAELGPVAALRAAGEDRSRSANVVVAGFPASDGEDRAARLLLRRAFELHVGVILTPAQSPVLAGDSPRLTLWVREQGPNWGTGDDLGHSDLALLVAARLASAWRAELTLVTAVTRVEEVEPAEAYLREVAELARLPGPPQAQVLQRPFPEALAQAPSADLHVLALSSQTDFDALRSLSDSVEAPCLFVRDSGIENAYA